MNNSNLKPFTGANDPRRSNGRPKGRKNLSTIIREFEDENYDWSKIPKKGKKLSEYFKEVGAPWRAIVIAAMLQALKGDNNAREWLRKSAYGNNVDVTTERERRIEAPIIVAKIKPRFNHTDL